jgi:hypothetical protein
MKRDQTVYTCDGCKATQAYSWSATPPGWYRVTTAQVNDNGTSREHHLCLRCYAGIDWLIRFQGITMPPAVITEPTSLRGQTEERDPADAILDPTVTCPAVDEHDAMAHCGLCGWEPTYDIHRLPLTRDTLPTGQMWLDEGMKYSTSDSGFPRITGTLRGHWPRLGRRETRPGEEHDLTVTVVDLVETADGRLERADRGSANEGDEAKLERTFCPEVWAAAFLAARFPDQPLQLVREPHLDIQVRHSTLVDEYSVVLELRAVHVLTPQVDDSDEPTA